MYDGLDWADMPQHFSSAPEPGYVLSLALADATFFKQSLHPSVHAKPLVQLFQKSLSSQTVFSPGQFLLVSSSQLSFGFDTVA